ncbi:bifunctional precorrin-2 dehydrogenase/sirohydrochlorin ferrochelatase [Alicyclobacillus acidoterrestris]|uniref:precorrin-2 dehydrogenase n=1 Tax=Alicyclobacillus acidoterrestris (strain ATCC 49025 / DSM 3922 / CIP 106132 / NCIMB 13137 / GD3B) TaxID=1356854 RepID=T0C580_ALIAG|nr:bifunctional precorrin-2 dehydrogenase/sirohydrochlorin ferrochelatase [Alicyclobacillus acidoterrestris]EPZ48119.1 hypothetical protein N007_04505 [Alicyclobacillus acidoterrestris ATCC 49025]UNO48654.1 bifunctional precorrin-2 dehydrogenase/sirohydrochlorin ferrochelatase [Alicyclobacillus acidoterrestris]
MHYAAFLNLRNKACVVVGGGTIATRKIQKLLQAKADVTVISPDVHPNLQGWIANGLVRHLARAYQPTDLAHATLAFAATDNRAVNASVARDAAAYGIWCNVADDAEACDFMVPAVHQHGSVQIAISTSGQSPALAKRLREALEEDLADGGRRFYDLLTSSRIDDAQHADD